MPITSVWKAISAVLKSHWPPIEGGCITPSATDEDDSRETADINYFIVQPYVPRVISLSVHDGESVFWSNFIVR